MANSRVDRVNREIPWRARKSANQTELEKVNNTQKYAMNILTLALKKKGFRRKKNRGKNNHP